MNEQEIDERIKLLVDLAYKKGFQDCERMYQQVNKFFEEKIMEGKENV